jgi:hypothetical protein
MTPVITSAMGGQPGTLMMGLSVMTLCTGVAWVGLGLAAWTQPQEAQEPQEMMALQSLATCFNCSRKGLPPMMQLMPSWFSGGLPSTARM